MRRWLWLLLAMPGNLFAQGGSEIYLADLRQANGKLTVGTPVNVTNRKGYDNQPAFSLDSKRLYFTYIDNEGQADIFRYDIGRRRHERITKTPESEYSPTPLRDGGISVVRVERDSTQRLWKFRGNTASLLLPNVKPVGYHVWIDENWIAMFILGQPNTLRVAKLGNDTALIAAFGIGRALQRVPGTRKISFVQRGADSLMHLRIFDPANGKVEPAGALPKGGEYHVYTKSGIILATAGTKLYQKIDGQWSELADFSRLGPVSRIAISPDEKHLAIVIMEPS